MKNLLTKTLLLLLLTSAALRLYSQPLNTSKLDSLFTILSTKDKAMGSLTLSKNGVVVYSRAFGYAIVDAKKKVPATTDTRYRIGSITKMFTATIVFELIEEGKLSLTTTLDKFYPSLPNAKTITIGNLLYHRSGLHNFTSDTSYMTWMTKPKTEAQMLEILAKNSPDFKPNEKSAYSNSNFVVLAFIAQKICKQNYTQIVKARITSKIGLANTYVGVKPSPTTGEAYSYHYENKAWSQEPVTDLSIPGGAGAIVSTPTDLTKFLESFFAYKLVSKVSVDTMKTIIDGLGMGVIQVPFNKKTAYGHNGGIDGFASMAAYFPEDSLAIAYCTNGVVYPMNDILIGVLSIYFNRSFTIPTFTILKLSAEDLDKYLGNYSSKELPLKLSITKVKDKLYAQATGQSAFPLESTEKDVFTFEAAGIILTFDTQRHELVLRQGGGMYLFVRDW